MPILACVTILMWVSAGDFAFDGSPAGTTESPWPVTGPPAVTSTRPADASSGVSVKGTFTATFSDAMDPATITPATFTVMGPDQTLVKGAVSFDAPHKTATFAPFDVLAPDTRYTATITLGARDLGGNGLAGDFVWSFTTSNAADAQKPAMSLEKEGDYSYVIPAVEVIGFNVALNRFDYYVVSKSVYGVSWPSVKFNLTHAWVFDTDPFVVDQLEHPYSGSIYHGFARSAGLNFWEAFVYDFMGSLMWKYAGETGRPTINDQISTALGGSFLGEALFRMATLVLKSGGDKPGFWAEVGAAVISPSTGFNRNLTCGRFNAVFEDNDPALFARLRFGGSLNARVSDSGPIRSITRDEVVGDFSLAYGLPGKPGYEYTRPFDYFEFELTGTSSSTSSFEDVTVRGLLFGARCEVGSEYRGVWGVYGSYDYISPEVFRISSSALSLGSTGQLWLSHAVALQGTALAGLGFGASGTIAAVGQRDYRYGTIPQAIIAMRLIFSDLAMVDMTAREYYVTGIGIDGRYGHENIVRGQASLTVRVFGPHALGIQWVASERDAIYAAIPNRHQTIGTISLVYNFLGDTKFGAVEWRNQDGP